MNSVGWAWLLEQNDFTNSPPELVGWMYISTYSSRLFAGSMDAQVAFQTKVSDINKAQKKWRLDKNLPEIKMNEADNTYSVALYEAIILYAHAMTTLHAPHDGDTGSPGLMNHDTAPQGKRLVDIMLNVSYKSLGENLRLDESGDRIQSYAVMNYDDKGGSALIGRYDSIGKVYTPLAETGMVWPGGATDVPVSYVATNDNTLLEALPQRNTVVIIVSCVVLLLLLMLSLYGVMKHRS